MASASPAMMTVTGGPSSVRHATKQRTIDQVIAVLVTLAMETGGIIFERGNLYSIV